jgi:adenylylsulfate kinase
LREINHQVLDTDQIREILTPEPTYTNKEREWFYWVLANIGELLVRNGVHVIFAATAHRRTYREKARALFSHFVEVYLKCPLEVCMERDQTGLYAKAVRGEIKNLPGVQELYEVPEDPQISIDTEEKDPSESVEIIIRYLENYGYLE